jgi:hypothetical protein
MICAPCPQAAVRRASASATQVLGVATLLGLAACADRENPGALSVTRRDSAGVEIVDIRGAPWSAPEWATVDTINVFRIIPDDSRPETLFGRVRGTLRMADGRIAVLDLGRHAVQLFAADGSFLRTIGREGQGPGELAQPWRLIRASGDTIGVYDQEGHVELLSLEDDGSRRIRFPAPAGGSTGQVLGSLAAGDYLAIQNELAGKMHEGTIPLYSRFQVLSSAGDTSPTLSRHQSAQFSFRKTSDKLMRTVETLFWAEPGMAVLPSGYAWCLATDFNCEIRSRDGTHVRTIRATVATAPVTDGDVAELTAMRLADAASASDSASIRAGIAEADRMPRFPVATLIRSDSRGRIWMRPYVWRGSDRVARWLVFELTGEVLGTVRMPAGFQVYDIGASYVLGTERGADDVEEVVMYSYEVRR